jgi:hypothetical protein
LVYFVVFYIAILILIGVCTGAYTGLTNKGNAHSDYRNNLGAQTAVKYRLFTVAGAAILACGGTVAGILPGTRPR